MYDGGERGADGGEEGCNPARHRVWDVHYLISFFFGLFYLFFGGGGEGELGRRNINLAIHFVSEGDTTRAKKTRELRGNTSRLRGWRWMNGWPHNASSFFPSDFFRFFCLDILCWLSGV